MPPGRVAGITSTRVGCSESRYAAAPVAGITSTGGRTRPARLGTRRDGRCQQREVAVGDEDGGPGELDPLTGQRRDGQASARHVDGPRAEVLDAGPEARRQGCRGSAGAARAGLADAALVDAHRDVPRTDGADELDVGPVGRLGVQLGRLAEVEVLEGRCPRAA